MVVQSPLRNNINGNQGQQAIMHFKHLCTISIAMVRYIFD